MAQKKVQLNQRLNNCLIERERNNTPKQKRKDGKHYEKDIRVRGFRLRKLRCKDGGGNQEASWCKESFCKLHDTEDDLDAEDSQFDEILQAAVKCIAKVEPDCRVVL